MDRRKFVGSFGLGLASTALVACGQKECSETTGDSPKQTGEKVKWKLVTSWPKNFPGLGSAPENLAKIVSAMTGGAFQIKVYGAGEIVDALEVFDAVSQGTSEMGHSAAYYWKGKMPASPFFTSVPFGLMASELNGWLHYGGGLEFWRRLYEPFGVLPAAGGNTGVQMGGWFNKKIDSLEDLKGLKMRIPGIAGEVFKALGGTPVALPGGEIFTSMQTGAIDATEWVGPYNDIAFGLHKVAKYYYYPGWHEPGPALEFLFNQEAYDKLPETYQAILTQACRAINQDMLDEYTYRNVAALAELEGQSEVSILAFPDDVMSGLKSASATVLAEVGKSSDLAKEIYQSYMEYAGLVDQYSKISDKAYLQVR